MAYWLILLAHRLSTIFANIEAEKVRMRNNSNICACDGTMKRKLPLKYALCGKKVISKEQNTIVVMIDGTSHTFDSNACVLMFKKFTVYGPDLFNT